MNIRFKFTIIACIVCCTVICINSIGAYADENIQLTDGTLRKAKEKSPKSQLSVLIYQVRKLDKSRYTVKSWRNFRKVLKESEECFYDRESTNEEYAHQLNELTQAKENLERKTHLKNIILGIKFFVRWGPLFIIIILAMILYILWKKLII